MCGDQALKAFLPDLFSIARFKDAAVAAHLELSIDSHQWNINLLRVAHDWEIDIFTPLSLCCIPLK